ncbi:Protein amnionless [Holothuria leucospilota]|uniref:Protein amnionless n=1 Tax=Holothuria leucospilota TaxID=206669 RepID=A0A9Q1CJN4_HOLLE|nr:Protein amnionless [Holothuria leucospilota]
MKILFFITLLCVFAAVVSGVIRWNKNVNFDNKDNWDLGRAPCASDKVIIPEESTSVFLQMNGTLKELILPMEGEIILANISFSRDNPEYWLNPLNWDTDGSIPVESDQVPCEYDDVVFPNDSQFYVGLNEIVYASTMTIGGQLFSTSSQASAFLSSPSGQSQFEVTNRAYISLSGVPCGDTTGCQCGNNDEETLQKICGYVDSCPQIACENPVKPIGSCCSICGGYLTMDYDARFFSFEDTKEKLASDYNLDSGQTTDSGNKVKRQSDNPTVTMYMSKTEPGKVQVVLTDNVPGAENGKQASMMAQQINADIENDPAAFGLTSAEVTYSGDTAKLSGDGISGGATAGIVIVLVIAIILVVSIIFIMVRRQPFMFSKDEPLDADIEMPSMEKKYMEELPSPEVLTAGFDNPMYDKPIQENLYADPTKTTQANGVEDKGPIVDVEGGFSNPMSMTADC